MGIENKAAYLSIVIPTKNEEMRLPETLRHIQNTLFAYQHSLEIIVSDDKSTDDTDQVCAPFQQNLNILFLRNVGSRGVGSALRAGIERASGKYILIYDADGAVPLPEVEKLIPWLEAGNDIAAGSRCLRESDIRVPQPWYRRLIGLLWRFIVSMIAPTGVKDTQCGFKLYSRETAKRVFSKTAAESFSVRVEALWLAKNSGARIKEVPIEWTDRPGTRIKIWRHSVTMLVDLIRLRWRHPAMLYKVQTRKISGAP